jgi:hypothetical protein
MADDGSWKPGKFAVWHQRWGEFNDRCPTAVLLRHPTAPFVRIVNSDDDHTLQGVAYEYLAQATNTADDPPLSSPPVDPPLELPPRWLKALNPQSGKDPTFWWLPIQKSQEPGIPSGEFGGPNKSFEIKRRDPSGTSLDRTIVLLASEWFGSNETYTGSEFGIRVILQVRLTSDEIEVRITGMSASLPFGNFLTQGLSTIDDAAAAGIATSAGIVPTHILITFDLLIGFIQSIKALVQNLLGLDPDTVRTRGVRLARSSGSENGIQLEWRGTGTPITSSGRLYPNSHSFVFRATATEREVQFGTLISKVELVADAASPGPGHARVFPIDPASHRKPTDMRQRRPTRSEKELDCEREWERITNEEMGELKYPLPSAHPGVQASDDDDAMEVLKCPEFVLEDKCTGHGDAKAVDSPDVKVVDLPGTPGTPRIRSNDFAAVSAYRNVTQFFQRLKAHGITATDFFRMAQLPLKVFYRSGIPPGRGKDGQTVNARIRVEGWPVDFVGPKPEPKDQKSEPKDQKPKLRPGIEMHLALADLSTRARKPWDGECRSPAEPLGIAADARWIWHEIGHVLLMASTGELVFRFCHSPGDALAAIVSDPQSELTTDANWRGATFPWVFTPRRHDRCVAHGWSWGGTMHYDMAQVPMSQAPRSKGYRTEQILSTSLFRLYRCIGGDTVDSAGKPDRLARESASHYATYLIMRGIQGLGPSDVVPAYQPDQLVSALIDADVGTEKWDVSFPPPPDAPQYEFGRIGGCVHKAIRWAFEAQGLYNPFGEITNAPGSPPPVDIYIESNRSSSDGFDCGIDFGPGSYTPVSLDWNPHQSTSQVLPWQAKPEAILVDGGKIYVKVGNRGSQDAAGVTVRVWWREWPDDDTPTWDPNDVRWNVCEPPSNQTQKVRKGATSASGPLFGPFMHAPPTKRYIVLAEATCEDDRANIDPATFLPCSQRKTKLVDLVPNDNNLGLRVVNPGSN